MAKKKKTRGERVIAFIEKYYVIVTGKQIIIIFIMHCTLFHTLHYATAFFYIAGFTLNGAGM